MVYKCFISAFLPFWRFFSEKEAKLPTWSTSKEWANRNLFSSSSKFSNQSSFSWESWFTENACYRVIKMTLSFYVMCFIATYSLSSNIQDQEFRSFHLVGFNSLVLVAGILTNKNNSNGLEENKNTYKDNYHLWTGAGTTKHAAWFGHPFFLSLKISLELRILQSKQNPLCTSLRESILRVSLLPLKSLFDKEREARFTFPSTCRAWNKGIWTCWLDSDHLKRH